MPSLCLNNCIAGVSPALTFLLLELTCVDAQAVADVSKHDSTCWLKMYASIVTLLLVIQQPDLGIKVTFIWKLLQACIFWDCLLKSLRMSGRRCGTLHALLR